MRASIVSILSNLELPEAFKRTKIYDINLEKYGSQVRSLNTEGVKSGVGSFQHGEFMNNPCFYINKEIITSDNRLSDLSEEMLFIRAIIQKLLLSFWLVKDNAINSSLIISKSEDNCISFNRAPLMFSNSNGEYNLILFSKAELQESFKWFDIVIPNILVGDKVKEGIPRKLEVGPIFINSNKNIPYQDSNRLQRALRFITIARSDSFLPAKITFYISALESLLSISNVELKMQVADRSARILGDDFETRTRVFDTISIAYSFRSNYIHGSVSKVKLKFLNSIEELSREIDDILRNLFRLFLTDLRFVVDLNDEKFSMWIKELLYK